MRIFGFAMSWLIVVVGGTILEGLVLTVLWAWFVIPVFHVGPITVPLAIGLGAVAGMLFPRTATRPSEEDKKSAGEHLLTTAVGVTIVPLLMLAFGAVVHAFV